MAKRLRLANVGQTTVFDLKDAVQSGTWRTQGQGEDSSEDVIETMEMLLQGNDATLIGLEQILSYLQEAARAWQEEKLLNESVWLEGNAESETARRAFVLGLTTNFYEGEIGTALLGMGRVKVEIAIRRMPFWEKVTPDAYSQASLSTWGGKWVIAPTSSQKGTQPNRIASAKLTWKVGTHYEYWFGLREPYQGTSSFKSVAELETAGTALTADVALGSESGASPSGSSTNNKLVCNFSTTAAMADRVKTEMSYFCSDTHTEYVVGEYLVLLRCKVDSGTTCGLRLSRGYGFLAGSVGVPCPEVTVTNTSYKLIPLGEIRVPPGGYRQGITSLLAEKLQLWIGARRTGGSGSLHLDALGIIPNKHLVYAKGVLLNSSGNYLEVMTFEDDSRFALQFNPSYGGQFEKSIEDFSLPVNGGMGVLFAQDASSHSLTGTLDAALSVYPRWKHYIP